MDLKTLSRYINYNVVAQAIQNTFGGIAVRKTASVLPFIDSYVKYHKGKKVAKIELIKIPGKTPIKIKKFIVTLPIFSMHQKAYGISKIILTISESFKTSNFNATAVIFKGAVPVDQIEIYDAKPDKLQLFLARQLSVYLRPDIRNNMVQMKTIGALPVGLKFKLNGILFVVNFQYQIDGKLALDLTTDQTSGQFDLTNKLDQQRAIAFLTSNANLAFDDKINIKNAIQIIKEITKEIKLANPAIKKLKPRVKVNNDGGGEQAPKEGTPEYLAFFKMQQGNKRDKLIVRRNVPTPPMPPKKENSNIPGRPTKINRINARGFDVVEKRSITYTKKSPSTKLNGLAGVKPYKKNTPIQRSGFVKIYVDVKKIVDNGDIAQIVINRKKYIIANDRDGDLFVKYTHKAQIVNAYLFDYATGKAINENFIEGLNGAGLYANINAKRKRIAAGSREKMRKPGSKGAPTAKAFEDSLKTAKIASPAQLAARAKFTQMVRNKTANAKKIGAYRQTPERVISFAGFKNVPSIGKVNFIMVPTDRAAKIIEALTALSYVPRIKISITRGKAFDKLPQIRSARDASNAIKRFFTTTQVSTQEYGGAIFTDKQNKVLGCYIGFIGGIDSAVMDPRLIFGAALEMGATGLILFHNHPSGQNMASNADIKLTQRFIKIGDEMQIVVQDHIIITNTGYYSLTENGDVR